jgi:hypothetical protein
MMTEKAEISRAVVRPFAGRFSFEAASKHLLEVYMAIIKIVELRQFETSRMTSCICFRVSHSGNSVLLFSG